MGESDEKVTSVLHCYSTGTQESQPRSVFSTSLPLSFPPIGYDATDKIEKT